MMYQSASEQVFTDGQFAWQSSSISRKTVGISHFSHAQRLKLVRQDSGFSGHDFFLLVSACLDMIDFNEGELNEIVKAFVDTHCTEEQAQSMNEKNGGFSDWDWISQLFNRLPEGALWALLRGAIAGRAQLSDEVIMNLDDSMQGQLFFESHVRNRRARIAFACSREHIIYMREAAGAKNVSMNDEEFTQLVKLNDSITFACFARCEQMKPHHLLFIQHKLAQDPHHSEFLASSYDAKITLMKALEVQGNSPELSRMRQALETTDLASNGTNTDGCPHSIDGCPGSSDGCHQSFDGCPDSSWCNYLNTSTRAESEVQGTFRATKKTPPVSTAGPIGASAVDGHLIN